MTKSKDYFHLTVGLFLAAFAFNLFLAPYNLSSGGVSGLSLLIHQITGLNESLFILISNSILLIFSYFFLGKETTRKTIVGSILFPIFVFFTNKLAILISLKELEMIIIAVLGGVLSGIGYGIVFKSGFTSGGTDIINQIIEKYFHVPLSKSIIFVDGMITLSSIFVFGASKTIYACIALLCTSVFSNKQMIGQNNSKTIYIASKKYKEINAYLHEELKIDSTDFECTGGYKKRKGKVILTAIDNRNYYRIKEAIKEIDPNAFIVATSLYHVANANVKIRE